MKPKPSHAETAALVTVEAVEPECLVVIETGDPRWDRARKMWAECQASFWRTIEGMVMLGGELLDLRKSLSFEGSGGGRKSNPQVVGLQRTWSDWCETELQISDETSRRYIKCFEAVQARAKRIKDDSLPIHLLGTPAGELADQDRNVLRTIITTLINGDSQQALLQELRINKPSKPLNGGDTSAARKANLAKLTPEIASRLWMADWNRMAKSAKSINAFSRRQDLEMWLHLIPLRSDSPAVIGLVEYRGKLATILEEAKEDIEAILKKLDGFIDAKHESATATAKHEAAAAKRIRRNKQPTTTKRKP
jgi:hypothetical protein